MRRGGWVREVHECKIPAPRGHQGRGSVWRCRRCGQEWLLASKYHTHGGYLLHWRWERAALDGPR